jgi:hypothetical protein
VRRHRRHSEALDEHHAHVERKRCNDQESDDAPGEQDEDLTPLALAAPAISC